MTSWLIAAGALGGIMAGVSGNMWLAAGAQHIAHIFKNLLEFVSLPIIFLSIMSTITGMDDSKDALCIGLRVLRYTLLTTLLAGGVGMVLFLLINPAGGADFLAGAGAVAGEATSYLSFLLGIVPSNLIQMFSSNGNVASIVFVALLLSGSILTLPSEERSVLHRGFSALFNAFLGVTKFIIRLMPIGVWAFVTLFVLSVMQKQADLVHLGWYVLTVLGANVVQGVVVLPLFLFFKGISPLRLFTAFRPALALAFFSKSSNATLPVTLECARDRAKIRPAVANFTLPLCSTINMNGCAAFILITVLFVGTMHGMTFSFVDMCIWLLLATVAAVGNAGVPMGCFFLTSAFLAHMQLPLHIMGVILPIYAIIDMVETALNVWSDSCVAAVVDRETRSTHS